MYYNASSKARLIKYKEGGSTLDYAAHNSELALALGIAIDSNYTMYGIAYCMLCSRDLFFVFVLVCMDVS